MRTFVLASVSNELLPKRRVLIKTDSERSRRLLPMFTRVLRRVRPSGFYNSLLPGASVINTEFVSTFSGR